MNRAETVEGLSGERGEALNREALKAISEIERPDEIKALQEQLFLELQGYFDEKLEVTGVFDETTKKYLKAHLDMGYDMGSDALTKEEAIDQFIATMEQKINNIQITIEVSVEDKVMDLIEQVD